MFGFSLKKSAYFTIQLIFLLFIGPNTLFGIFMGLTALFQLTFTFIYNTFSKNFSVSAKLVNPKQTLSVCLALA